jgi:hypothetical protein
MRARLDHCVTFAPYWNKGSALKPSKSPSLFCGCLVLHELGSADFRSASRNLRSGSPRTWAPAPVAPRGRLGEGGELMRHRRPLREDSKFHGEVPPRRPGGSGNVTQTSAREVQRAHPVRYPSVRRQALAPRSLRVGQEGLPKILASLRLANVRC